MLSHVRAWPSSPCPLSTVEMLMGRAPSRAPLPSRYSSSQYCPTSPSPSVRGLLVHQLDLLVLCVSTTLWAVNPPLTCWSSPSLQPHGLQIPETRCLLHKTRTFSGLNQSSGFSEHPLVLLLRRFKCQVCIYLISIPSTLLLA